MSMRRAASWIHPLQVRCGPRGARITRAPDAMAVPVDMAALLSIPVSRLALALRINALAKGYSGVTVELIEALIEMYNRGVVPAIPEQGSVGASGDLAPLAHMALVVMGEGEAFVSGH